jgi:type IV pilus assembly protein PilM
MPKAIWAMDFGAGSLKVVRGAVDRKTGEITVDLMDEIPYGELPCGYDASPRDKHREGVIEFRKRHEVAPGDDLCVSVTGSEVFSRFISLPPVRERIGEVIKFEARQQIPFDIDDVVWDWQKVREDDQEGEDIEVGLFALKKERVDELLDILQPWRGNLRVIQNAPLAIYNLLEYEGLVDRPLVVLDMGAATTDVLALNPPRFWVRSLLVAGNDLTNALVEKFGVSFEEAEQIKQRVGQSRHRDQIIKILAPVFNEIASEIQRSLGYYKSLQREVKFDRVLLLGNALRMAGARQMLARRLQYQVQSLEGLRRVKLAGPAAANMADALPGFAAPLGVLIQGAGQGSMTVNMVPEEIAAAGAMAEKKPWLLAAAAALLAFSLVSFAAEKLYAGEVDRAREQLNSPVVGEVRKWQKEYSTQKEALEKLQGLPLFTLGQRGIDRALYIDVLSESAGALPRDVFVTTMAFVWRESDEPINKMPATLAPRRAAGGAEPGPARAGPPAGVAGGGPPEWLEGFLKTQVGGGRQAAEGRKLIGGGASGEKKAQAGFAVGTSSATSSGSARLVLYFSAESRVVTQAKEFVDEQVLGGLRAARFPGSQAPVFAEVGLAGDLRDVWRTASTGEPAAKHVPGSTELFAGFDVYAVVNTKKEQRRADAGTQAQSGGKAPAAGARSE